MTPAAIRRSLLAWYDINRRTLAWRSDAPDPYRVWLSEIMLQQTTVPHATPYFLTFTRRWPTITDLANAPDADVMAAWAGLGYYARARNLLACARVVAREHGGAFPNTEEALRTLPGVGAYTAAAIAAIAFSRSANVVDGNVERVMARLHAVETPLPGAKPALKALAGRYITADRPGDWAQALMDLGAVICRPKAPVCERCPISNACEALKTAAPETYPRKTRKPDRPRRFGDVYVLTDGGHLAVERRPDKGLLGGMLGLPGGPWTSERTNGSPPIPADWKDIGEVEHAFTHFSLTLRVHAATGAPWSGEWTSDPGVLPSVFLKAVRLAQGARA